MLTSVWREILNDSISGDKLAGGTVYPPFDLVYVKRMYLGSPTHYYSVISMDDEDSAEFGLGWYFGYGKIRNYFYQARAIESPTPTDAAPMIKLQGRTGSTRMIEMTMDKVTRCGILYAAMDGETRFQIYPSGTSYMLDKFVFGSTTFDNDWPAFKFQSLVNSLFRGRMVVQGDLEVQNANFYCNNGQVNAAAFVTNGTIYCNLATGFDIKTAIDPMFAWYSNLVAAGFGDLSENEVDQIEAIGDNVLNWPKLETVNQNLSTIGTPEFAMVKSGIFANPSGAIEIGKWYSVSNISVGEANGINVDTAVAKSSVGSHDVKWCWLGTKTIVLSGVIQIVVPSPGAGVTSLIMNGTFAWARPKNYNERGFGCWSKYLSPDRSACLISVGGPGIAITPLIDADKMTGFLDFCITYEVDGPIPTA